MDMSSIAETITKFGLPEKIRQRLSQRPACADAAAELYALSRQLESDDLRIFAAACSEGVAACEGTAENPVAEAEALVRAARLHMEEEKETYKLSLPTTWDSLYFAIDNINKATDIYENLGATHLAVTTLLELARVMLKLARPHDAIQTFLKALDLNKAQNGTRERLVILRSLADAYIQASCLVDALNTYEEICVLAGFLKTAPGKLPGYYHKLAQKCETRQILLLLITEPTPKKMSHYHSLMFSYFTDPRASVDGHSYVSFLDLVGLLRMKDFVLAIQQKDFPRVLDASEKLYPLLDETETALADFLVDRTPHHSGY
ncbi:uncharacterized protein LOC129602862 [Paramacrobiotus metropolitanus]|uniref:uncharacterized protein LOC129602862 n=1 Tax=Paramacrobiotus metropolitanus TaxID=2943436 RepID=UPI0024458904|nr:uncharacterized protein LOC129602862 [Paramacrobiotus metropolitanus]